MCLSEEQASKVAMKMSEEPSSWTFPHTFGFVHVLGMYLCVNLAGNFRTLMLRPGIVFIRKLVMSCVNKDNIQSGQTVVFHKIDLVRVAGEE